MSNWQKKANYKAIKKLDGVIVLGESLKYIFEGMIDESKIYIVPNCVDDEFLLKEDEIEEKIKNIKNKEIKDVLYLSNFIKEKGYEYILKLAKNEKENFNKTGKKSFHFHFAGKFFNEKDKQEWIDFLFYRKNILKKCDIFVLLTRYPKEGQPISILEAMGNGMVIVTTNHAGIPDIAQNEKNGMVVNKNEIDLNEIYEKLRKMNFNLIFENNYNNVKKYMQNNYTENMKKIL